MRNNGTSRKEMKPPLLERYRPIARLMSAVAISALFGLAVVGCEPQGGEDVGVEEGAVDTLEMGADREQPIVPPTEGDTGMLGRDTAMAGEDTMNMGGDTARTGGDGTEEDTLAAVRPQPPTGQEGGAAGIDESTLQELESLIDQTVRDLERAQQLLRNAMNRGATGRQMQDTAAIERQ